MGVTIFPAASAAPVKSIQRGSAASAGTITISAIDTTKSFVRSYSTGSAGSVGITGTNAGTLSPSGGQNSQQAGGGAMTPGSFPTYAGTRTITAGATALVSAEYGIYITNSTTITATGACNWEVVEYN